MGIRRSIRRFVKRRLSPEAYLRRLTISRTKQRVVAGPFVGMQYVDRSIGSAYLPKLLGTYEREIYPVVEEVIGGNYDSLIDVGAAEGFFAVGLAMKNNAPIIAFEANDAARALAHDVAQMNKVESRIDFRGTCAPADLETVLDAADRPFLLIDVEGGEADLLNPTNVPSLSKAAVLVEIHEFAKPGITAELFRRFDSSHDIEVIWQADRDASDFPYEDFLTKQFPKRYMRRAVDELRGFAQSWLWMTPKTSQTQPDSLQPEQVSKRLDAA